MVYCRFRPTSIMHYYCLLIELLSKCGASVCAHSSQRAMLLSCCRAYQPSWNTSSALISSTCTLPRCLLSPVFPPSVRRFPLSLDPLYTPRLLCHNDSLCVFSLVCYYSLQLIDDAAAEMSRLSVFPVLQNIYVNSTSFDARQLAGTAASNYLLATNQVRIVVCWCLRCVSLRLSSCLLRFLF